MWERENLQMGFPLGAHIYLWLPEHPGTQRNYAHARWYCVVLQRKLSQVNQDDPVFFFNLLF